MMEVLMKKVMDGLQFFVPMKDVPTTTYQNRGIRVVEGKVVDGVKQKSKAYSYERDETKKVRQLLLEGLVKYGLQKMNGSESGSESVVIGKRNVIYGKDIPLSLNVKWCFGIKGNHYHGEYRVSKPDTDNLQKMLKDCMTALGFWYDDAQVVEEHIGKYWSDTPGIWVKIVKL